MKLIIFFALVAFAAASKYPNGLNFELLNDWNLVPDATSKLVPMHHTELVDLFSIFFNAERDVRYVLFTPRNPINGHEFRFATVDQLANSNFDRNLPTRFVVHGWLGNQNVDASVDIRAAYMARGGVNVIVVDWGAGARTVNYLSARNSVSEVADVTARFIDRMVANLGISTNSIKIAGHSLGAHITGITGKLVRSGRIAACIGLDPAGPLFYYRRPADRINRGDCTLVEIHHTNGWTLGFGDAIGDIDFYPNGGSSQPNCGLIDIGGICAHNLAPSYFAESINSARGFWSEPCYEGELSRGRCSRAGGHLRMGGEPSNAGTPARGVFFLETASRAPFALGPR